MGELEELVLLCVCILDRKAYGVSVREALKERAGRAMTLGAVHATLYRLEDKGYLASELGGATAERGGRRKRLFRVTNAGLAALRERHAVREEMWTVARSLQPALKGAGRLSEYGRVWDFMVAQ